MNHFRCPTCRHRYAKLVSAAASRQGYERRWKCDNCDGRFTTVETLLDWSTSAPLKLHVIPLTSYKDQRGRHVGPINVAHVKKLREGGMTYDAISKALGCSLGKVWKAVNG
jgi:DNA invertase Pin-like site-specific DNA recombinase